MLKKCQILGFLVLVLGIIGSFYVAYEFGNVVDFEYSGRVFYERDWNLTCAYFATGCFSSILLWTILEKKKNTGFIKNPMFSPLPRSRCDRI